MVISRSRMEIESLPELSLNGVALSFKTKVKNVWVWMNNSLTWDDHITQVCAKVYGSLRSLRTMRIYPPQHVRLKLVRTLLIPHLLYCDLLFASSTAVSLRRLLVAFNSCIRYVHNLRRFDHISSFAKSLLNCTLLDYYSYRYATFIKKLLVFNCPSYLSENITLGRHVRTNNILVPRHNFQGKSVLIYATGTWNSIPYSIKILEGFEPFRQACFGYFAAR